MAGMDVTTESRPPASPGCPPRPSSTTQAELGFVRQPMVRWLDPRQLVDTTVRIVLSGIFGSYADKREVQALIPGKVPDRSQAPELWVDYVADLGDGWNSTYTVARLLALEELGVGWDGRVHATRRGRILVMGGDQVYPVPNRADYENRMLGPYKAAMPCAQESPPELFAIPGSHDWYDGLVNFTSVFCRGHWIGGWSTQQSRSYFAVKLPHGWWLWGIDIQFGAYIDEAQLEYFSEVAERQVEAGDRIILCMAKEVEGGRDPAEIYSDRNLEYFERQIVQPSGGRVVLYLKSGRHHYCRYEEEGGASQHITAGGGGAFLHPTHHLPDHRDLPREGAKASYRRAVAFPSAKDSKRLRRRLWLLPFRNPGFAALLGGVQVLLAFMLGLHRDDRHVSLGVDDMGRALWESPTAFVLILTVLVLLAAMVRFAHDATGAARLLLGVAHSVVQLATLAGFLVAASRVSSALGLDGVASLVAFLVTLFLLGGAGGTLGMAGYLWASNCLGFHGNEAYAPLRVMDFKNFLRLHIGADGVLTLYPIGIDRVCRKWRVCPDGPAHAPWFDPAEPDVEVRLIEEPLRFAG